jgi:hypothetical protein
MVSGVKGPEALLDPLAAVRDFLSQAEGPLGLEIAVLGVAALIFTEELQTIANLGSFMGFGRKVT